MDKLIFFWLLIGSLLGAFDFMNRFQRYQFDCTQNLLKCFGEDLVMFLIIAFLGPFGIIFFFIL
jgi:hypothetical protein